jgi:hypothetical protein
VTLALSIRQPWASLVIHGGKDIENRTWWTDVRGPILIHAAKGMTRKEYELAMECASRADHRRISRLIATGFSFDEVPRGGIIGSVNLVDCVRWSQSRWFVGPIGFAFRDPRPFLAEDFIPYKGQLGFFDVPDVLP